MLVNNLLRKNLLLALTIIAIIVIIPSSEVCANPIDIDPINITISLIDNGKPIQQPALIILECRHTDYLGRDSGWRETFECSTQCKITREYNESGTICELILYVNDHIHLRIPNFIKPRIYVGYFATIDINDKTCKLESLGTIDPVILSDHYCEYIGIISPLSLVFTYSFVIAVIIALLVENIIILLIMFIWKKITKNNAIIFISIITITNLVTVSLSWHILPNLSLFANTSQYGRIFLIEVLVTFLEAIIYYRLIKLSFVKSISLSIFANLVSFIIGILIFHIY